jgi:hypothetical protein
LEIHLALKKEWVMAKHDSAKQQGHEPKHNSGVETRQGDSHESQGAGSFGQQAKDVAAAVAQQTRSAVNTAAEKSQEAFDSARQSVATMQERAREAVAGVPGQMRHLAGEIRERGPQQGTLGNAAHTVASTLDSSATYLEEHDVRAMAEDLAAVIRKNPIPAVLAGIGVGFLLGRTFRR